VLPAGAGEEGDIMGGEKIDRHLDLRGKVCPGPTFDTRMALNEMRAGERLEVVTDYYPAKQTIPMLMRELGYPCDLVDGDEPVFRFIIQKV
jgi:tRNA 2-thiouridine synthesizing protein A